MQCLKTALQDQWLTQVLWGCAARPHGASWRHVVDLMHTVRKSLAWLSAASMIAERVGVACVARGTCLCWRPPVCWRPPAHNRAAPQFVGVAQTLEKSSYRLTRATAYLRYPANDFFDKTVSRACCPIVAGRQPAVSPLARGTLAIESATQTTSNLVSQSLCAQHTQEKWRNHHCLPAVHVTRITMTFVVLLQATVLQDSARVADCATPANTW